MREATMVLAHQGGWDEIALVGGPLVALFLLLVLANKRARRRADGDTDSADRAKRD